MLCEYEEERRKNVEENMRMLEMMGLGRKGEEEGERKKRKKRKYSKHVPVDPAGRSTRKKTVCYSIYFKDQAKKENKREVRDKKDGPRISKTRTCFSYYSTLVADEKDEEDGERTRCMERGVFGEVASCEGCGKEYVMKKDGTMRKHSCVRGLHPPTPPCL